MTVYTFPASLYADAIPFASTEYVRYYLCGVYLGAHIVATDGHRLIAIDPGDAGPGPGVILGTDKALLAACKPGPREATRWITIDTVANTACVSVAANAADAPAAPVVCLVGNALVDGSYPEYLRVLPQPVPGKAHPVDAFDPRVLAPFLKLRDAQSMTLTAGAEPGSPYMVRFGGRADVLGVIMPMRSGSAALAEMPGWIKRA
jgi:hypothetical protein